MSSVDSERERLACAIADGLPIDWSSVEQAGVLPPRDIAALKQLDALRRGHGVAPGLPLEADGARLEAGFELLKEIGQGSTSRVWRARDKALNREVALKVLRDDLGVSGLARTRFLQEARLLASVDHPNVVRIHSISEEGRHLRLSLELVHGVTLDRYVREQGRFSIEDAAHVGVELCKALAALHARGLVHRDIKPGNVMRGNDGRIVLLDFSLVRTITRGELDWTSPREGTPLFMAPEQFEGRDPIGPAADVYGLAALLYWLVSLRHPCAGETFGEVRARAVAGRTTPLREVRPDAAPGFAALVERGLHLQPGARHASVEELRRELEPFTAPAARARRRITLTRLAVVLAIAWSALLGLWLRDARSGSVEDPLACLDTLVAPVGSARERFGWAVDTDGVRIVVGTARNPEDSRPGSVYVYRRSATGWELEQELQSDQAGALDLFGRAVAIQGDWLAVGASRTPIGPSSHGQVHLFHRDAVAGTWVASAQLSDPAGLGDEAGFALEWAGDRLLVGAPGAESSRGQVRGEVRVFRSEGSTFVQEATLEAPDGARLDGFGSALAFHGSRLAVGAPGADTSSGVDSGALYVFRRDEAGWTCETREEGSIAGGRCGASVALDERFLVGGEPASSRYGRLRGSLLVVERTAAGWGGAERLTLDGEEDNQAFGRAVWLAGDRLLAAAPGRFYVSGELFSLRRHADGWSQSSVARGPRDLMALGFSLAASGSLLVCGAQAAAVDNREDAGVVHLYELAAESP